MSEAPRFGIDPDTEAEKLGSSYLARNRHNIPTEPDEDRPEPSGAPKKISHASRRGGRSLPEKSGRDFGREIADADRQPVTSEQRAANRRGAALAHQFLAEARPEEETPEQKAAQQAQEVAEIQRKAEEPWDNLTPGR
jgi:hypothetical protein